MGEKKVLVTGSNGLLGQKITDIVLRSPALKLMSTSRGPNRHPIGTGYTYLDLDITDQSHLRAILDAYRPDCVINTAAMTNVDACEQFPAACWKLNVEAVDWLSAICKDMGAHLVHLSTDFIFDGLKNGPYEEEDPTNPLSVYGKSKLASERIIQESECEATILRTVLVYGVIADMSRSNIVLWAKKALENKEPIRVVHDQWRMPTLAEDLACVCLAAAINRIPGIFHVSGPELLSVLEIVEKIADFWNLDRRLITPVASAELNQPAPRPRRTEFLLEKAARLLNYRPSTFNQGLSVVDAQLRTLI